MARLKNFIGSIFIGSGMKPKGDYPLMEAHDIVVDENGTRLDEKLDNVSISITYDKKAENITFK